MGRGALWGRKRSREGEREGYLGRRCLICKIQCHQRRKLNACRHNRQHPLPVRQRLDERTDDG